MWTNLFELLDGLFRGMIYFFYNFVETAYRAIRHPTTGPLLLFRKHRNPAQRQIGGLTFLFLSFFGLLSFWLLFLEEADTRDLGLLSQTISELPNLEAKSLWPTVAGAMLSTVAIDAPTGCTFGEFCRAIGCAARSSWAASITRCSFRFSQAWVGRSWLFG